MVYPGSIESCDAALRAVWDPSLLELPLHYSDSPDWHGHLPFGMWLVHRIQPRIIVELGVLKGDSYCAFCQAVKATGINCQCFGVDTWQGDLHTGRYGENILAQLRCHHDVKYAGFSTLMRCTFDEAQHKFANGTIDLLHIDGFHSYRAVRHDFETWRPKLSDRAIVLFHDIGVIQLSFGVWRFWAQVCRRYPHFSFFHSNGLGVLAVGQSIPERIRMLFDLNSESSDSVRHLFENLGRELHHTRKPIPGPSNEESLPTTLRELAQDKCGVIPYTHRRQYCRYAGKILSFGESAVRRSIKSPYRRIFSSNKSQPATTKDGNKPS